MTFARQFLLPIGLVSLLSLSSCSFFGLGGDAAADDKKKGDPTGGYADYIAGGGSVDGTTYNVTSAEELERIDNEADGEVFFTDPDAPEAEVTGITEAFENKRSRKDWYTNPSQASRLARLEGLPLLVWFHDSVLNPQSKALGRKLLQSPEFLEWSESHAICLCLDAGKGMGDVQVSSDASNNYRNINKMQQSYGLKKKPSFVVISPQGKVITLIDGYDGYTGDIERQIKEGVEQASKSYAAYKVGLKKKGFRDWYSADGERAIFAKLTRFDQNRDILYLKDAAGKQYKVHESKFHNDDVDYIENHLRDGGPKY